jgi:hypothetical protein
MGGTITGGQNRWPFAPRHKVKAEGPNVMGEVRQRLSWIQGEHSAWAIDLMRLTIGAMQRVVAEKLRLFGMVITFQ